MSHAVGSRHKVASNGIDILTFSIPYVLLPSIMHFNITVTQTHKTLLVTPKEMSPVDFEHFPDSDMRIIGWIDINSIGFTTYWLNMVLIKVYHSVTIAVAAPRWYGGGEFAPIVMITPPVPHPHPSSRLQ